ncbi:amidohydrolase family protein [Candidatus Poribacteria bacterium]|nr:amidohydrolase family protein [Candidatus Poribacteria bacterium]
MILRAKYVLPDSEQLIENGAVLIAEDKIIDSDGYPSMNYSKSEKVYDFGEAVILPGLVNAHTHLELTNIHGQVKRTENLADWLMQLMKIRDWNERVVEQAISVGIAMSLAGGASTVADITNSGWSVGTLKRSSIRKLVFYEAIGFEQRRLPQAIANLSANLDAVKPDALLTFGISPHAPYSVAADLYRKCRDIALSRALLMCTHLAESQSEHEFLMSGTGPFRDLLKKLGISVDDWHLPRQTPVEYMRSLGILDCSPLLAHCNYLKESDIQLLQASNASVVFCPRSHNNFYHRNHPFEKLMKVGVNVALGTDSLASNDSLSMLDELKFLHKAQTSTPPETLFSMATLNGAKALKLHRQIGALQRGWQADIIAVQIPPIAESATHGMTLKRKVIEKVLGDESQNIFTMVAGEICYNRE